MSYKHPSVLDKKPVTVGLVHKFVLVLQVQSRCQAAGHPQVQHLFTSGGDLAALYDSGDS